jgi:hypothetical protein
MILSSSSPDDWSGEWMREIGWVGYYFGQLEWAPIWLAQQVGSKTKQKKVTNKSFQERCEFVRTELLGEVADPALRARWDAFLTGARGCAKLRNEILHNPLELNVDEINRHGIRVDQGIRLLRGKVATLITIGDVQAHTESMIALHKEMIELMVLTPTRP